MANESRGPESTPESTPENAPKSTTATLFDLRTVIAVLFGVYGVVLTVRGIVGYDEVDRAKAGTNLNLQTGIAMLVLAALFAVWLWLRPIRIPDAAELARRQDDDRPAGH